MSESPDPPATEVHHRAQSNRILLIGAGLVLACAAVWTLWKAVWGDDVAWLRVPETRIQVPAHLKPLDRIPLPVGKLAGHNVLLITLDTTRADRLGCYGNQDIETPALDRLAGEGILFSDAISTAPTTLPAHASILTGLYPVHHGARTNGWFRLAEEHMTLAERLRREGYATGAFISAFVLDARYGLAQGMDEYDDKVLLDGFNEELGAAERRAEVTTTLALDWLATVDAPFFLWVHYFDPHANYAPPRRFLRRYAKNPYDGEIAYMDTQVARLLEHLDANQLADQSLVLVVGDHGEGLGGHDEHTHGFLAYDVTLRVPMIVRCGNALAGGLHVARRVSTVDLVPTALALLGLESERPLDGVSLLAAPSDDRRIFAETYNGWVEYGWAPLLAVYAGDFKYIYGPDPELYNLAADPLERHNLAGAEGPRLPALRADLAGLFGAEVGPDAVIAPGHALSAEELARLQSLGYASGGDGAAELAADRPDPKSRIEIVNRIYEITCVYEPLGMIDKSIELLEELAERYPDDYSVQFHLGSAYWKGGQPAEAAEAFSQCVSIRPRAPEARRQLALLRIEQGELKDAAALLEALAADAPDRVDVRCELSRVLLRLNRFQEALSHARRAFELKSDDVHTLGTLVRAHRRMGKTPELVRLLEETLDQQPSAFRVRRTLAATLVSLRRYVEAEALLRAGVALAPVESAPRARLAYFLVSCPDESRRNDREAQALLLALGEPPDHAGAEALFDVARVQARWGKDDAALRLADRARGVALKEGRTALLGRIEDFILRTRQGLPFEG